MEPLQLKMVIPSGMRGVRTLPLKRSPADLQSWEEVERTPLAARPARTPTTGRHKQKLAVAFYRRHCRETTKTLNAQGLLLHCCSSVSAVVAAQAAPLASELPAAVLIPSLGNGALSSLSLIAPGGWSARLPQEWLLCWMVPTLLSLSRTKALQSVAPKSFGHARMTMRNFV